MGPSTLGEPTSRKRRVRHALLPTRWPTEDEAARSRWLQPLRLGASVVAEHSTWVPAMVPWRASADGVVTPEVLDWYGRFADGRPGVLVVEATGIRDVPSGPLLRIGDDRFVPGLAQLVETVRRRSAGHTRLFIQVIDFVAVRRRPTPEAYFGRHLAVTPALRERLARALDDARWLDAAEPAVRRALSAGFDGTELHYAHAYTMAGFLSRLNTRADGYGGSREGRVRLPLEVLGAVRGAVPRSHVVGIRYLGDEVVPGGSDLDDAVWFGRRFAHTGTDYLSVSKGGSFEDAREPRVGEAAYPYTGDSGWECMPTVWADARGPFGRNVPLAAAIRRALRADGHTTPVITSGGIATFEQAEGILARGEADAVGAARQSLADPDWFRKVALGLGHLVRRCEFTNYCEGLDQRHKPVTCKLWDRSAPVEPGASRTSDGRRLIAPAWSPPARG